MSSNPTHLSPETFPNDSSSYQIPLIWPPTPLMYSSYLTVIGHFHIFILFHISTFCLLNVIVAGKEIYMVIQFFGTLSHHVWRNKYPLAYLKNDLEEDLLFKLLLVLVFLLPGYGFKDFLSWSLVQDSALPLELESWLLSEKRCFL